MSNQARKIYWAFDPFVEESQTWDRSIEVLKRLVSQGDKSTQVVPCYVIGHETTDWVSNLTPNRGEDLKKAVTKAVQSQLKELNLELPLAEPKVVFASGYSRRAEAKTFLDIFEAGHGNLMVVNTHARTGLKRFFMGSFTETLAIQSRYPILFVSPHTDKVGAMEKVLFPTDLSDESQKVFENFLDNNFGLAKEIVLYSKILHPSSVLVSNAALMFGGGPVSLEEYFGEERSEKEKKSEVWAGLAKKKNFKTELVIDHTPTRLDESILSIAEQTKTDWIAMPSFATQVDAVVVGSTTRHVIRESKIPVLTWHVVKEKDGGIKIYG